MAKKQNNEMQMSIFDIELPPNNAEIVKEIATKEVYLTVSAGGSLRL